MNQVLPYRLWLGHAGDGRDLRQLFDADIRAVVQVAAEEPPSQPPRELVFCRFPLLDGVGNDGNLLLLAVSTVATLLREHVPTLVCDGSGLSRSPAVAAAALAFLHGGPPEDHLQRVTAHHPSDVSPGLWNELTGLLRSRRP